MDLQGKTLMPGLIDLDTHVLVLQGRYKPTNTMNPIAEFDELATAVRIAAMKGKNVAVHAHSDSSIRDCVNAGVYTIEHATYISDETLKLVADKGEKCYLVPTLAAMHVFNASPDSNEFWNVRLGTMLRTCAVGIRRPEMGLQLGFGTDSAAGGEQNNHGLEFKFRKEHCQQENVDILR